MTEGRVAWMPISEMNLKCRDALVEPQIVENQKTLTEHEFRTAVQELAVVPLSPNSGKPDEPVMGLQSDAEVQLMIDHTLGKDFPPEKRDPLLRVHRAMSAQRDSLVAQYLAGNLSQGAYFDQLKSIVQIAAEQLATVLTGDELRAFLGVRPGEPVELPF
jgi:hypothetical protein